MTHDQKERLLIELLPNIRAEAGKFARRARMDREELIQEGAMEAWRCLDRFDEALGYQVWTFIATCINNRFGNLWAKSRRQCRWDGRSTSLQFDVPGREPEPTIVDKFVDLIAYCKPRERDILTRIYRDGVTQQEIGQNTSVTYQCISQVARRGLNRIREHFAEADSVLELRRELRSAKTLRK